MATWDRRLTAAAERLDHPGRRASDGPPLPEGLHPDDAAAAEALIRLAAGRRGFATVLRVRRVDEPLEAFADLRIEATDRGVHVRVTNVDAAPLDDPLTQLPGRAVLLDRIRNALAASERSEAHVAVLYFDIDGFKMLNDAFGYSAGDEVLRWVAARLAVTLRPADTLARLNGDEFIVVAPGIGRPVDAVRIGDRLRAALLPELGHVPPVAGLTASVGIAVGRGKQDPEELLSNADTALYLAKARGRDRCQIFDDALRTRSERRITIDQQLRRALDEGGLAVHYQPIVSVVDVRPFAVEALVRITSTDILEIHPHELLQTASDNGLLRRVETSVLEAACTQVQTWGDAYSSLGVSVNITGRQFRDLQLPLTVNRVLRASGLDPTRLCIEITESTLVADTNGARAIISRLRALGVRVAVDEFCGNHVILRLMPGLGVDSVKLDRSMIEALTTEWGRTLMTATLDKASELGVDVTAVGVETPEQLAMLRLFGCNHAQGYLIGRPLPSENMAAALAELSDHGSSSRPGGVR